MAGQMPPSGDWDEKLHEFFARPAPRQQFRSFQAAARQSTRFPQESLLHTEAMGGDTVTREEIDAKIAASEARTDTKFARLEGQLGVIIAKMDSLGAEFHGFREDYRSELRSIREDNRSVKTNIWGGVFALAALIVAIAIGLPTIFDFGAKFSEAIRREVQSVVSPTKTP